VAGPRLHGKFAFITGGASGIGFATAQRFAEEGAQVALADINDAGAQAGAATNPAFFAVHLDVTDEASWDAAIAATLARFGRLDVLVNSAGVAPIADVERETLEQFRRVMAINVDGVFLGCRASVRAMKDHGGSIVNLSSVSGLIGGNNIVAYNASKGAVRLLTKSVALHCARKRYGIRCNSVHPTFVETPMFFGSLEHRPPEDRERIESALRAQVPLGRFAKPVEIADLIVYLASDESQFVTGAEHVIDGGMTAGF
jgi:NAD(P)-dependent dehydrogenase (short-subunit alcohol dehydrogenase family)